MCAQLSPVCLFLQCYSILAAEAMALQSCDYDVDSNMIHFAAFVCFVHLVCFFRHCFVFFWSVFRDEATKIKSYALVLYIFFSFLQRMEPATQYNVVVGGKYVCEHNLWRILTDYHTNVNFKVS